MAADVQFGVLPPNNSIAELLLQAGNARAATQQREFDTLGDVAKNIGQIPGQALEQQRVKQQMALEAARAQRESTLADIQQKSFDYANQQRKIQTDAIANNPSYDRDAITSYITKNGGDASTLESALGFIDKMQKSKIDAINAADDYKGHIALALYPHIGTPAEPAMVKAAMDEMQDGEKRGILSPGTTQQFQQHLQQNPGALPQLVFGAMTKSPAALKALKDSEVDLAPGHTLFNRLLGGGGAPGATISAPGEPGTVLGYLNAKYGAQPQGGYSPAQQAEAEQALAQAKLTPEEKRIKSAEAATQEANLAGTPGSQRHQASVATAEHTLTALQTPADKIQEQASKIRESLQSGNRTLDSTAAAQFLSLVSDHARISPGNVAMIPGGQTFLTRIADAASALSTDPNAPKLTAAERQQMVDALKVLSADAAKKSDIVNETRQALVNAPAPQHPQILADLHKQLTTASRGGEAKAMDPNTPVKFQGKVIAFRDAPANVQAAILAAQGGR